MAEIEVRAALEGVPEFVAEAIGHLVACLGEDHPSVADGRRARAALDALPRGTFMVTEESLATAIHRVWPYRRNTQSSMTLSAAAILAALKTAR